MAATVGTPLLWAGFTVLILALLALDLGLWHRKPRTIRAREALAWSLAWIGLALAFSVYVWVAFGSKTAAQYLVGYLLEKSLSVDNIFVFYVIFAYFAVPPEWQQRVLYWGILGALVLRGLFIAAGAVLVQSFDWVLYVFGAFLVFTGLRLLFQHEVHVHPERNPVVRLFRRFVPMTEGWRGARFWVREGGRRLATPLLLVLVVVEATDVVFAVDSIPAIFLITQDPFIVWTSNVFAILGLRALYFLLAGVAPKFRYLKWGLGLVLVFIGLKMFVEHWIHVPIGVALAIVAALIGGSILLSVLRPAPPPPPPPPPTD